MAKNDSGPEFSMAQLNHWRAYERVRSVGRFNMYDPRARRATGLSGDEYLFVMKNYSELKDAARKEREKKAIQ